VTITTNDTRNEYTATASQTVFNYTFKIFESTDLNVYQTPAGQTPADTDLITAYTVVGEGLSAGGSITLNVAATIGDLITIVSDVPESRTTDYQFNGDFIPDTVNDDFDRVVSLAKQSQSIIGRTPQFPEATQNATGLSWEAPEVGGFIRWKSDLSGLENIQLNTAVGADNAAAISFDNSSSGLSSTDVQGAIDEIDTTLDATGTSLSALNNKIQDWETGATENSANGPFLASGETVYNALNTLKGENTRMVKRGSNQSIPNDTETAIVWLNSDIIHNTDNYFVESTSTSNFNVFTGTDDESYMIITATVTFEPDATGIRELRINVGNGQFYFSNSAPGHASRPTTITVSTGKINRQVIGKTGQIQDIRLWVYQDSGGSLDIIGGYSGGSANPTAASINIEMHNRDGDI